MDLGSQAELWHHPIFSATWHQEKSSERAPTAREIMPVSTLKDVNKEDEDDKDRQAFYVGGQGQNGGGRFAPTCSAMPSAHFFLHKCLLHRAGHLPLPATCLACAGGVPSDCLKFKTPRVCARRQQGRTLLFLLRLSLALSLLS